LPTRPSLTRRDMHTALYAALVCFCTYCTLYAFRKPFTVSTYEQAGTVWGVAYKSCLVVSQVLGYLCAKIYGIRFIAALGRQRRASLIFWLAAASWGALLLFALLPSPINIICLFANGFPQGLLWGVIFSYVEGRRATDFIGAALAVSFIFASGLVKSVAEWIAINWLINEYWLPFVTGLVFMPALLLFLWLLEKLPPPGEADEQHRKPRLPMTAAQRKTVIRQFLPGLRVLTVVYVFLTIFRDIRDNFMADMWKEAGYVGAPSRFVQTEIPITLVMLLLIGAMVVIQNNFKALRISFWMVCAGFLLAGLSSVLYISGQISIFYWLMGCGMGLYMGYIPFNSILFDRMIASFGMVANVGFFMYVADSFGYIGSVAVTMSKSIFKVQLRWTEFYAWGVTILSIVAIPAVLWCAVWFTRKYKQAGNSGLKN
jgi:MFS family permease